MKTILAIVKRSAAMLGVILILGATCVLPLVASAANTAEYKLVKTEILEYKSSSSGDYPIG